MKRKRLIGNPVGQLEEVGIEKTKGKIFLVLVFFEINFLFIFYVFFSILLFL